MVLVVVRAVIVHLLELLVAAHLLSRLLQSMFQPITRSQLVVVERGQQLTQTRVQMVQILFLELSLLTGVVEVVHFLIQRVQTVALEAAVAAVQVAQQAVQQLLDKVLLVALRLAEVPVRLEVVVAQVR
jgi:hypothetical protein